MKKYNSKDFRKNNHFILYDMKDKIVCYFSNCDELLENGFPKINELVRQYNNSNSNIINVIVDDKKYQLYTFA